MTDQEEFLNAVAIIQTDQTPDAIASTLRTIEHALKKEPPFRFGPRTIDLDLLLYGTLVMGRESHAALTIPHPRMHERRFVLEPLCELINVQELHPQKKKQWSELLQATLDQRSEKVAISL